ncbi:MAG: nucleotidyltransferase family protein [Elusimicrobiales bacterium]|nr:nucleotidyltransferase family protein [Elusimicrobiales bacterium]
MPENSILARNLLLMSAAEEICAEARKRGLRPALLKGAALLALGVFRPDEREMSDVDLLIAPAEKKKLESVLADLGFAPMPDSDQAWLRETGPASPPVIADIHTGLWHARAPASYFLKNSVLAADGVRVLSPAQLFAHMACHPLLHHGEFGARAAADLARLAGWASGKKGRALFLKAVQIECDRFGLRPAMTAALEATVRHQPGAFTPAELAAFAPRGLGKVQARFFRRAAERHSAALEYFLPVLHRPELLGLAFFPDSEFLKRRYGRSGLLTRLLRPFKILKKVIGK